MKYHSRPKPVKIRIESGGEEHFSLDSFLKCFNPKELFGKKSELMRWLEFQGDKGKFINEQLSDLEFVPSNIYQIYKAFFSDYIKEKNISRLVDLYASWYDSDKYKTNFKFLKEFCYDDENFIERLYKEKMTTGLEPDWFGVIKRFVDKHYRIEVNNSVLEDITTFKKEIGNPNLLYYLGVFYKDANQTDFAKIYLKKAYEMGVKKAGKLADSLENKNIRFSGVNRKSTTEMINYIIEKYEESRNRWNNTDAFLKYIHKNNSLSVTPNDREIIKLVLDYMYIECNYNYGYNYKHEITGSPRYIETLERLCPSKDDFLTYEKNFIRFVTGTYENEHKSIVEKNKENLRILSPHYIPAKYLADENYKNKLLDDNNFRGYQVSSQIKFILKHIFDFE